MAFVKERIPDEEITRLNTLGVMNWTGIKPYVFMSGDYWCVDKKEKSFLISLGGGRDDDPIFWLFWWNGLEIRIEERGGSFSIENNGKIVREITGISVPEKAFESKDELISLILDAFSVRDSDKIVTKVKCNLDILNGGF